MSANLTLSSVVKKQQEIDKRVEQWNRELVMQGYKPITDYYSITVNENKEVVMQLRQEYWNTVGRGKIINYKFLIIPDFIDYIGSSAFRGLHSLERIVLRGNTTIDDYCFTGCRGLKEIDVSKSDYLGCNVFSLTQIRSVVTNTVRARGGLFSDCDNLEKVTFTNDTLECRVGVFKECRHLKLIEFHNKTLTLEGYIADIDDILLDLSYVEKFRCDIFMIESEGIDRTYYIKTSEKNHRCIINELTRIGYIESITKTYTENVYKVVQCHTHKGVAKFD